MTFGSKPKQMFRLFKCQTNYSWGLHIADHHLRCVEVDGDQNNWRIVRLGKIDLPEGLVQNGLIQNSQVFQEAVRALCAKTFPAPGKSPYVLVNLAEEHVFSRVIQTPPLSRKETDEAIKWEAESNIPLPIEKVYLSWEPLPAKNNPLAPAESVKKNYVLLSAVSKDIVDYLLKTLREAGLKPVAVEAESGSLMRGLHETQSFPSAGIPILIVNLREYFTSIIAFDSQVVVLSTTSDNCSSKFDAALMESFKIKIEECEKFRHQIGWNPNDEFGKKLIEATAAEFANLKKGVSGALSFFENKSGKKIEGVLLAGEKMSKWTLFDKFLEKEIGLPVKWQSGWNPKIWPANCPYVTDEKEEYNIGIGLALRKLDPKTVISPNLLPPEAKEELCYHAIGDTVKKVVLVLSAILVILWLAGGALLWKFKSEETAITRNLEGSVDSKKLYDLGKMNEQFKEMRTLNSKVEKSGGKEYRFSEMLAELTKITPPGVALTDFETNLVQPGWVKITGVARSRDNFLAFKKGVDQSQFYEKIDSPAANYISPQNFQFELNVKLKNWTPGWAKDLKKSPVKQVDTNDNSDQ